MYYLQNEDFTVKREGNRIVFNWKDIATISYSVDMAQEWLLDLVDTINDAVARKEGVHLRIGMYTKCSPEFANDVLNAVQAAIGDIIEQRRQ